MEWILPILLICISLMIYFHNFKKKNNLSTSGVNTTNQQKNINVTHGELKKEISHRITDYLNKNNILYTTADGGSTYRIIYENGETDDHQILIKIPDQKSYIKFSCLIFRNVPDEALSRSAEIITRINNRYTLGNL